MSHPNMSTLMKRLEAATSRLEDLANFYETDKQPQAISARPSHASSHVDPIAKLPAEDKAPAAKEEPKVQKHEYPELDALTPELEQLVALSKEIDADLAEQVAEFKKGNDYAISIAKLAGGVKKPEMGQEFTELFKPVNNQVEKLASFRDAHRTSKFINHFQTVGEGALVFGWVSCPNPSEYVKDLKEAAQFYANKVLKDFRETPPNAEWVKTFLGYCNNLARTLSEVLPEGLEWSPNGITLSQALSEGHVESAAPSVAPSLAPSIQPSPKTSVSAPAPPPPPTSAELMADKPAGPASTGGAGGLDALFADISSKGTDIHSGLKHIDRKALPKPTGKPKPPKPSGKTASTPAAGPSAGSATKPPSTTLVENKWVVENYVDKHDIVIEVEMKQTVFIENCHKCTIVVKNKGTSVTLNNCKKVGIMVDTLVSGLDFLGCSDCQAQTNGRLPSLMLDKSNNMQIYLNDESLEVDIRTVNTWAINLEIPTGEPGDYTEAPIAEQISHTIDPKTKKVKSIAVAPGQ